MKKLFLATVVMFLLSSCSEKKSSLESHSPDKRIKLTVTGTRSDFLSPWSTELVAEGKGLKGNISFEFYGADVSDNTVSFVWDKEDNCDITFNQKDKTQRIFEFMPDNTDAMWKDLSPK